jgi:hypothetical protein
MIIVYDSTTGEIIGGCSRVFDNGKWREAAMEEIYPQLDRSKFGALYLQDDPRYFQQGLEHWRIRRDESGVVTGLEQVPAITLSCDASDHDNDGIPDLPADGTSSTKITARLDVDAKADVTFRTTRGSLSNRTVATANGQATVELRAATETVAVIVTATALGYRPATLHLEFIPLVADPSVVF